MSDVYVLVTTNGTTQRDHVWAEHIWDVHKKDHVGNLHETARGDKETIYMLHQLRKESNHAN
jgi:hypothetical protein